MYNLDDLIQEIYDDETVDISGELSAQQKNAIKKQVLASDTVVLYKSPLRKSMVFALAAALVLLLGFTVSAADKYEWDIRITNFMGLNDPSTLQLETGEVQIDAACESNGLNITNVISLGDKNTAYIRIDTNYELPEDFNETTDYILPENFSIRVSDKKESKVKDYGSTLTAFYEDNKLGFLMEISNCESLNKSYVSLRFENLVLHHDLHIYDDSAKPKELLLEGNWELDWKYSYKSSTKTYHTKKKIHLGEHTILLTDVDVSPISVRISGRRQAKDFDESWKDTVEIQEIGFKDGTVLDNLYYASGGRSNTSFDSYYTIYQLGIRINPVELDYIIVENQRIDF